jgi:uncharacterized protein YecE (DUF72 family)
VRLRRSGYDEQALEQWAEWLKDGMKNGKDAFVFLKHEDEGSPWLWADRLFAMTA